ncbi:DeoR/GlpR transcriptional regulator [Anaerobacillus sp. CMMVII]|uniref:DeoR/GlpR family DNA-binding transcription regulator n=1 Tax=Anaerobacillus sp. CMMVII TaxID=2755588 RepID=UPI0021B7E05B|nr:DeoR/GlpR family DNA-binding transcription regulator [Anaerobacillus sp. CMMVII]MCT8137062.1 DeoR/GlpR transcriptional regulator [Anaerobacillus sp. CMMVII]
MLTNVRQAKIIEILNLKGAIKVVELSEQLQVTEKTIREDLDKLDEDGIIQRVRGGAILPDKGNSMLPINRRQTSFTTEKEEIANKAFQLIEDGQTLLLDAGSTTLELAKLIINRQLTVITNDIKIMFALMDAPSINLIGLGGMQRKGTSTVIGMTAIQMIHDFNIDLTFIGATGVDIEKGLSIFSYDEVELKKAMIKSAKEVALLADNSKFNRSALVSFASLVDVDFLVTNSKTDDSVLTEIGDMGVKVLK